PGALAFRIPALVGPTRTHAIERQRGGDLAVRGDLARPFSFLHEQDCAELCAEALLGAFGSGILNAASSARITVREYYHSLALRAGSAAAVGSGETVPSRWIDAGRLQRMCPGRPWRDHAG
ncbi:MAG: hypothetical protein H0W83_11025, partial [Planctomycetes bacterium]|nr:hypothetical protein [Planctomycetota bacterium]